MRMKFLDIVVVERNVWLESDYKINSRRSRDEARDRDSLTIRAPQLAKSNEEIRKKALKLNVN